MVNDNSKLKNIHHHKQYSELNLNVFKKTARIALWVSAFSLIILGVMVASIDNPSGDYFSVLANLAQSQDNLLFLILLAGAWLISATAATTYLITLYSTFRIAGPLYRFARNLEFGHQHEQSSPHIKIRSHDCFQEECQLMDESINTLIEHYQGLAITVEQLSQLPLNTEEQQQQLIDKIVQLKEIEQRLTR